VTSANLLLHPVRLRIVQAFLTDRVLTTRELQAEIPDVSVATLYRHIGVLVVAAVLEVVSERKIRGTVERTYRLTSGSLRIDADVEAMSTEDHRQSFIVFVASLLADFDRYLADGDNDLARDTVGYRQMAAYLTDDELRALIDDLQAAAAPHLKHEARGDRRRVLLSTVLMPVATPSRVT
jgi:DNA-binding HxlR family transcriptional regulator